MVVVAQWLLAAVVSVSLCMLLLGAFCFFIAACGITTVLGGAVVVILTGEALMASIICLLYLSSLICLLMVLALTTVADAKDVLMF